MADNRKRQVRRHHYLEGAHITQGLAAFEVSVLS